MSLLEGSLHLSIARDRYTGQRCPLPDGRAPLTDTIDADFVTRGTDTIFLVAMRVCGCTTVGGTGIRLQAVGRRLGLVVLLVDRHWVLSRSERNVDREGRMCNR